MKVVPFLADSPAEALAQIHAQLGPEAVVLSVRPVPKTGLARLWQKNRAVEVLAGVEEAPLEPQAPLDEPFSPTTGQSESRFEETSAGEPRTTPQSWSQPGAARTWRGVDRLENQGLLPVFADRLQQRLYERHGALPPVEAGAEWPKVQACLAEYWRPAPPLRDQSGRPHVFIGPAGCGKTTLLCKWLACSVLLEERTARVWRLDSANANTAEILNVYGEMFGVGIERFWHPPESPVDLCLVDVPGTETADVPGLVALEHLLAALPSPRVHLVLNAAYDTPILFEQFRAFARFKPEDLSFTHLDEETRPIKLWNFVLGTNCCFRFLCAGQKIPGQFLPAEPSLLFPPQKVSQMLG